MAAPLHPQGLRRALAERRPRRVHGIVHRPPSPPHIRFACGRGRLQNAAPANASLLSGVAVEHSLPQNSRLRCARSGPSSGAQGPWQAQVAGELASLRLRAFGPAGVKLVSCLHAREQAAELQRQRREWREALSRCVGRRRVALRAFLEWFWSAFDDETRGALGAVLTTCDPVLARLYGPPADARGGRTGDAERGSV